MIKVPVDRFEELLDHVSADSDKMQTRKISSEDVTMQWVDTRSRLETKKEVRERYLELLRQAHSMKDILSVQGEIDQLQEEMDAASGRIAYLGHAAAFSTVNLHFYQVLDPQAHENPSPSYLIRIKTAIAEGGEWLGQLLVELLRVWPLWVAGALGWWGLRRRLARKKPEASKV
jgi:hypothetical protein